MPFQADVLTADTLELRDTTATVAIDGVRTRHNVRLPFNWDAQHPTKQGTVSFELVFDTPNSSSVDYDLYVPSISNAYSIWLNGTLLRQEGDLQDHNSTDYMPTPRYISIALGTLREKSNTLRIDLRADRMRHAGISPPVMGPDKVVYALYKKAMFFRSTVVLAMVVQSAMIGIFALALWATQRSGPSETELSRDPLYLIAGLAELCWLVTACDAVFELTPLRWPWWGVVKVAFAAFWLYLTLLFCLHVAQWNVLGVGVLVRRWFTLNVFLTIAASIGRTVYGDSDWLKAAHVLAILSFFVFSIAFLYTAFRGGVSATSFL